MASQDPDARISRLLRELAEEREKRLPPAPLSPFERAALLREVQRTLKPAPPKPAFWGLWRARLWPRLTFYAAAAAAVVAILALTIGLRRRLAGGAGETATLALHWVATTSSVPFPLRTWRAPQNALPQDMPDFDQTIGTLGAAPSDPHLRARLATIIVRSESGFGSGALISADGWLLSSYRVVADAAQRTAVEGRPAVLQVVTARLVEQRIERHDPPLKATLYRADPRLDLALLKLEALPAQGETLSFLALADAVRGGEECFVVGSQPNGPAWSVHGGNVMRVLQHQPAFPRDANGVAGETAGLERIQATLVVSDALLSPGDAGAPLLNEHGELIGVTCAPAVRSDAVQAAWHVALPDLRRFLANLPSQPEGVPLDPWTAGLPDATALAPELVDGDGDGRIDSLRHRFVGLSPGATNTDPRLVASILYVDLTQRTPAADAPLTRVPKGLWGMEDQGHFRFDLFLLTRADGVVAAGYAHTDGVVDDIRIGRSGQATATLLWQRDHAGRWQANLPSTSTPLVDSARVSANQLSRLRVSARENLSPIHSP